VYTNGLELLVYNNLKNEQIEIFKELNYLEIDSAYNMVPKRTIMEVYLSYRNDLDKINNQRIELNYFENPKYKYYMENLSNILNIIESEVGVLNDSLVYKHTKENDDFILNNSIKFEQLFSVVKQIDDVDSDRFFKNKITNKILEYNENQGHPNYDKVFVKADGKWSDNDIYLEYRLKFDNDETFKQKKFYTTIFDKSNSVTLEDLSYKNNQWILTKGYVCSRKFGIYQEELNFYKSLISFMNRNITINMNELDNLDNIVIPEMKGVLINDKRYIFEESEIPNNSLSDVITALNINTNTTIIPIDSNINKVFFGFFITKYDVGSDIFDGIIKERSSMGLDDSRVEVNRNVINIL